MLDRLGRDGFADRLGNRAGDGPVRSWKDQRHFFAAIPRGQILLARRGLEQLAKLADDRIARGVTESVVDALKLVDVDHQQRDRLARLLRQAALLDENLVEFL